MLVKSVIWVFEQITTITEFRFGSKFAMGLCVAVGIAALGVGISKIPSAKSPEEYLGMFIYAGAMAAFASMVWWLNRHYPERGYDGAE